MSFIGKDKGGDWHYAGDAMYHCIDKKGVVIGRINGAYIPDPIALWNAKCLEKGIAMSSPSAGVLKPNDIVCKLWEHYNANSNN